MIDPPTISKPFAVKKGRKKRLYILHFIEQVLASDNTEVVVGDFLA